MTSVNAKLSEARGLIAKLKVEHDPVKRIELSRALKNAAENLRDAVSAASERNAKRASKVRRVTSNDANRTDLQGGGQGVGEGQDGVPSSGYYQVVVVDGRAMLRPVTARDIQFGAPEVNGSPSSVTADREATVPHASVEEPFIRPTQG